METGYLVEEGDIITRVAEGTIAFLSTAEYVAVARGTTDDQVIAATTASEVLGFVKKPVYGDLEDGDTVAIVMRGVIKVYGAGTISAMEELEVGSDPRSLRAHASGVVVARALQSVGSDMVFVQLKL